MWYLFSTVRQGRRAGALRGVQGDWSLLFTKLNPSLVVSGAMAFFVQ